MTKPIHQGLSGYKFETRCKVCKAKNKFGEELRGKVDEMAAKGASRNEIQEFLRSEGIYASKNSLHLHFKNHAPYVKTVPSKATARMITTITHGAIDSRKTIEKIIGMGSQMIDNWWNGIKGVPQMPVTERILLEALKEEGRRAPRTAIDQELDLMEKEFIEGEEVTDEIPATVKGASA